MADIAYGQIQYLMTIARAGGGIANRLDYFRLNQGGTEWFYWIDGHGLARDVALPTIPGAAFVDVVGSLNDWILLGTRHIFPSPASGTLTANAAQPPGAGIALADITLDSVLNAATNILTIPVSGILTRNVTPLVAAGADDLTVSGGAIAMEYDGRWWPNHLRTILNTRTQIPLNPQALGGHVATSFGTVVLHNEDGQFDDTATLDLQDNALVVYRGLSGTSQFPADFETQLQGVAQDIEADTERVRITVRDRGRLFRKQVLTTTYAGTGAEEGDPSVAGQLKPLAYGNVRQVLPVLISAADQIYQFNTTTTANVVNAKDRENALPANTISPAVGIFPPAAPPPAGTFNANPTTGFMRLGAQPVGPVTIDLVGGDGILDPGNIIRRLIARAGFPVTDIDTVSFSTFGSQYLTPVGIYLRDETSYEDAITSLITGSAWYVEPQTGLLRLIQIAKTTSVFTITEDQLLTKESIRRLTLPAPPSQLRLGYNRAWHVFDEQLTPEFFYEPALNPAPLGSSDEIRSNTAFIDAAFTQGEATRQLNLWLTQRNHFRVTIRVPVLYKPRIGDTITLVHSRLGLSLGLDTIIMGIDQSASSEPSVRESYTLTLWG